MLKALKKLSSSPILLPQLNRQLLIMTSLQNATDKEEGSTIMGSETVYDPLHERVFIWTLGGPVMVGRFAQKCK